MIILTMTITTTMTANHNKLTKRDCATSSEFDNNYNNNQQGVEANLDMFGDFIRIWILSRAKVEITFETNCNLDDDE